MENKILLVDDEKDVRDVLNVSLTDMGYDVFEAESGDQALHIFKKVNPSIVLTDIKMPGMDGIELLRKVKHENPDAEVIMITGHGAMDLAIMSLKYEAADFITKPINVDVLEIAVQRAREKIITRQKLREYTENLEKLVREKMELQSHLSSLGLMVGSISHGIKGLLTGLDGGMYLLNLGFAKDNKDQIKEGWDIVKRMVKGIRKMVLDILFYAKERELKLERIDVLSLVEEVVKATEPQVKERNIEFKRDFDSDIGDFEVDAGYIQAAVINIIENAMEACAADRSKKDHRIVLGARQAHENIVIEVADNGIGMDLETKEKIFTPFFSSKGKKGTGLGLFISNTIIEQHGGKIIVKSAPGKGTIFNIIIPKMSPESVNATVNEAAAK